MTAAAALHAAWRNLPFGTLTDIIGSGSCLVLAPHPDDESLGCGGLIASCVAENRPPLVAILTDGSLSHHSRAWPPDRLKALRQQEARTAVRILGLPAERLVFLEARDGAAPTEGPAFEALVHRLTPMLDGITAILATSRLDPHGDHQAAAILAARLARDTGLRHIAYPIWGWTLPAETQVTEPPPKGWRLDITNWQTLKRAAIDAHQSQQGAIIDDDPNATGMAPEFKALFLTSSETYLMP